MCEKKQLKSFIVIIALCVFSEVIFEVIMPSKEAARRNRRKSKIMPIMKLTKMTYS